MSKVIAGYWRVVEPLEERTEREEALVERDHYLRVGGTQCRLEYGGAVGSLV